MNKVTLKTLWSFGWAAAMMFAKMTKWTQVDDQMVATLSTDLVFEEFWAMLVSKGWASNTATSPNIHAMVATASRQARTMGTTTSA